MKLSLQNILKEYKSEQEKSDFVKSVYFDADLTNSIEWIKNNSAVDKNNLIYRGYGRSICVVAII